MCNSLVMCSVALWIAGFSDVEHAASLFEDVGPRLSERDFFNGLDLGLPGLERVKEAVENEDYIKRYFFSRMRRQDFGPVEVPPGHVFAMGDNRDVSKDSRSWGFVPFENIKGQTFLVYWSWNGDGDWLHKIRFSRIGRRVK